ncbi:MAG: hypothetical protein PHW62_01575 [Candidatus Ratteibacteria bacterium]|nr:hypothetical protein [Candidatus Ratteibacteria bacterium]
MNNDTGHDRTYYKVRTDDSAKEDNRKGLSEMQEKIFNFIMENRIVTGKSIRLFWSIEPHEMCGIMRPLFDNNLIEKTRTQKQAKEPWNYSQGYITTEAEERQAKMQELNMEINTLSEEYSRKRRELNRIFEMQEKAIRELSELSKEDYKFYHGEKNQSITPD